MLIMSLALVSSRFGLWCFFAESFLFWEFWDCDSWDKVVIFMQFGNMGRESCDLCAVCGLVIDIDMSCGCFWQSKLDGVKSVISRASKSKADHLIEAGDKIYFGDLFLEVWQHLIFLKLFKKLCVT